MYSPEGHVYCTLWTLVCPDCKPLTILPADCSGGGDPSYGGVDSTGCVCWGIRGNKNSSVLPQVCQTKTSIFMIVLSLVPRPHPDFISQPWRKIGRTESTLHTESTISGHDIVLIPGLLPIFLHGCKINPGCGLGTRLGCA